MFFIATSVHSCISTFSPVSEYEYVGLQVARVNALTVSGVAAAPWLSQHHSGPCGQICSRLDHDDVVTPDIFETLLSNSFWRGNILLLNFPAHD